MKAYQRTVISATKTTVILHATKRISLLRTGKISAENLFAKFVNHPLLVNIDWKNINTVSILNSFQWRYIRRIHMNVWFVESRSQAKVIFCYILVECTKIQKQMLSLLSGKVKIFNVF